MERYTANLKLPKILSIHAVPGCSKSEEERMMARAIFLHTPTGGMVEILLSGHSIVGDDYMQMPFYERVPDSGNCRYTAVLLNNAQSITAENGLKAMQEVAKWYIKLGYEIESITSKEWVDYPDWLQAER